MKKKALVCTQCEEVEWVIVAEIQTNKRSWWVCLSCHESNAQDPWK